MKDYDNQQLISELNRIAAASKAEYEATQERLAYYRAEPEDSQMYAAFNLLAGMIEKRTKHSYLPDEYWTLLAEAKQRGLVTKNENGKQADGTEV